MKDRKETLITEAEAARVLSLAAGTLKKARIHRLANNPLRDLPYVRIGRSVRYRRSDIEAYIEAHAIYPGLDNNQ